MRSFDVFRQRLRSLFRRTRVEAELDAELQFHLDQLIEEKIAAGMQPDDARRAALRSVGSIAQYQEECRDMRRLGAVEDLLRDLRYATRSFAKSPGFAAAVVVTLAVGIGVNTAVFAIAHAVLLRPLDHPRSDQLVYLSARSPAAPGASGPLSAPEYAELGRTSQSFSALGAYSTGGTAYTTGEVNLLAGDQALRVRSISADARLLETLGVRPRHGRLFTKAETEHWTGTLPPPIAILSHEFWQTAFAGRPLIGRAVEIEGRPHEIVGVMPPGADVMDNQTQVWLPLWLHPSTARRADVHLLHVVARLKGGVDLESAQTELRRLVDQWSERAGAGGHAPTNRPAQAADHALQLQPLQDAVVGNAGSTIWVLQAASAFLLIMVCANLANLVLARAESRRRELALRTALGAGRGRLLRQSITEGALISVAGGCLGLLVATVAIAALLRAYPGSIPRTSGLTIGGPTLLVPLGLATITTLLLGFLSVARPRGAALSPALKEGGRVGGGGHRRNVRRGLVIAQTGFAVMLVTGAGLLSRTVHNLSTIDAGFDRTRLVTFAITLPMASSDADTRAQAYRRVLDGLGAVPGILGAVAMSGLPPQRTPDAVAASLEARVSDDGTPLEQIDYYQFVMGDYFATMGIPILAG